jgi:hypothetical protein
MGLQLVNVACDKSVLVKEERHTIAARVEGGIRIEVIQVRDLIRFVEEFFRNPAGKVMAPISRRRALALAEKPFADPHDPALIVAYAGENVVTHFLGTPALFVHFSDQQERRPITLYLDLDEARSA